MAKDKPAAEKAPMILELTAAANKAADEKGMVTVRALPIQHGNRIVGPTNNGHTYAPGDVFPMHMHLVPRHALEGQVEIVG